MGLRGKAPQPTALRVVRGNPGKRALNKKEPKPGPFCAEPPPHLDEDARAEWARLVPMLEGMKVLTAADAMALGNLCMAYSTMTNAWRQLATAGLLYRTKTGHVTNSPLLTIINAQMATVTKYLQEFGMTPASRSRVQTAESGYSDNPFAELDA